MEGLHNMDVAASWYYNAKCISTDVARIFYQTNRLGELYELLTCTSADNKRANPDIDQSGSVASDTNANNGANSSTVTVKAGEDGCNTFA